MSVHRLEREQLIDRPLADVFDFFARASNLERITPPWLSFGLITPEPIAMGAGTLIEYKLRLHGLPLRWVSKIEEWEENRLFVDRQLRGPYRLWRHRHEFASESGRTRVRDQVDYSLPLGPLGEAARVAFVRRDLARIFDYRVKATQRLLG
jgi:ligand-binding SRPBCC domain-containing protein